MYERPIRVLHVGEVSTEPCSGPALGGFKRHKYRGDVQSHKKPSEEQRCLSHYLIP
jgi:hypothetical protein